MKHALKIRLTVEDAVTENTPSPLFNGVPIIYITKGSAL